MSAPILATKLYIPSPQPKIVLRPRLIARLNESLDQNPGFGRNLTLVSAAAGFGKTTLVSEWVNRVRVTHDNSLIDAAKEGQNVNPLPKTANSPVAWLSLDERDSDPTRFMAYFIAALQTIAPTIGDSALAVLQSPTPPSIEAVLTMLLNDITNISHNFILVLDDYHNVDAREVDNILAFLLEHLPPQMHLVMTTREDPNLPLARLRVRGKLTELRAIDLRFTPSEAAEFLNSVMGLTLSTEEINTLESRTEGWIAGLQLAALALRGQFATQGWGVLREQRDSISFIQSFTGSHRFLLDYLVEEVLQQQPANVQTFLLHTSVLDRLCGSLCDAVLLDPLVNGQETLKYLEQANLFIVPLDNERHWYRYHHLFAEFLRQRLQHSTIVLPEDRGLVAKLHGRASVWYEDNGQQLEAFQQAAAANDIDRAARLVEGGGMPLLFRGAVQPVLNWLTALPTPELDARPALWVMYASALLFVNQITKVEEKLQFAEKALQGATLDERELDLIGHIASIRATLAVAQNDVKTVITQSHRALAHLHLDNLPVRTATTWSLGFAYQLQGERVAASQAYTAAISSSKEIGHFIITIMASLGLGNVQETNNQLHSAAETYQHVLQLTGDQPLPVVGEAHFGLARIYYEWNDLEAAEQYVKQSAYLMRQIENNDRFIACEVFLARLKLAQGDTAVAVAILNQVEQLIHQHNFVSQLPSVTAVQLLIMLQKGNLSAAAHLAQMYELPISQARVHLAQGDASAALALLEPLRQQAESKDWADERIKVMVLQAVAYYLNDERETAVDTLTDTLALAKPHDFIRLFVDEGPIIRQLLSAALAQGIMPNYTAKLLAVFDNEPKNQKQKADTSSVLVEPLSPRELEVLQLVAQGLSNREISERLFLALDTVKGHNRRIYAKLQVKRRTEAVAKAKSLNILPYNN